MAFGYASVAPAVTDGTGTGVRLNRMSSEVLGCPAEELLGTSYRALTRPAALDVDDSEKADDRHGPEAGDLLLVVVATGLRDVRRATDTVARLGGDADLTLPPTVGVGMYARRRHREVRGRRPAAGLPRLTGRRRPTPSTSTRFCNSSVSSTEMCRSVSRSTKPGA